MIFLRLTMIQYLKIIIVSCSYYEHSLSFGEVHLPNFTVPLTLCSLYELLLSFVFTDLA